MEKERIVIRSSLLEQRHRIILHINIHGHRMAEVLRQIAGPRVQQW